ncbi:MAG TPA: biliverdin-producing heme oxygenase [Gemmatimonadales bacterium]|nr:biliverdin-producing heme oxygenase [Gemmatimonadales bacterium]
MSRPLSLRLKEDTAPAHQSAERTGIVADMLHRRLKREDYIRFLRDLHAVYEAMEAALERTREQPSLSALRFPELDRAASVAADLATLHGASWQRDLPLSSAARKYVERIGQAESGHPERLAAHAYVRYLGDLSGGQMLKKLIGQSLGLNGTEGLEFYEFPRVPDPTAFKDGYRRRLDEMPLSAEQADGVVAEARDAFMLNMELAQAATSPAG